jgi:hypothetical protein
MDRKRSVNWKHLIQWLQWAFDAPIHEPDG